MKLLVSVRSVEEAEAALEGGAHVIDVKEPLRGSLGRASDSTIEAVLARVAGRRPVSAALGELANEAEAVPYPGRGLAFVKWGLFGMGERDWREALAKAARHMEQVDLQCQMVTVAYADWQWAGAPGVEEVAAFARNRAGSVLLVDTFQKAPRPQTGESPTLLDLLPLAQVVRLCGLCREARVGVALAGSLQARHIKELKAAQPDWLAVRGAVCEQGRREAAVSARKVRELVALLG
ncbi:MAG: (5-formylfuran-3-yl)methyl phosphate synthase [Gemmataceae bacterium]|nr:(5-formylfuran-3-yl)methyl phosphate synthase [Gemmataceae bacterium]